MKYIFNVDEDMNNGRNKEKNTMKLYLFFYKIIQEYKYQAMLLISVFSLLFFSSYRINIILKIILSISVGGFITSAMDLFFSTQRLYDKICRFINYDVYIREMTVFNDSINDRLKESSIVPAVKICYDIRNVSNKKFALIFKIDDDSYKIAEIIDCDKNDIKISKKIYSDKMLDIIKETDYKCVDKKGLLFASIVLLKDDNMKERTVITEKDFDNSLLLTEVFFIPYLHENKEKIENNEE